MKNMSWTALAIAVGVLSAAVVLAQSGPATPTQDSAKSVTQPEAKQETKMPSDGRTKWEYRIESIELLTGTSEKSRNDPEGMKMRAAAAEAGMRREAEFRGSALKVLGEQGWELVDVYTFQDSTVEDIGVRTNIRYVFKRKL
ncbi:MAG TPA: hypothetical protein PLH94_15135 [Fimbriimonadaceae bacterium]|nr:hypothetical protein [Fimbriimonadaceae bacterium]